MKVYLVGGAVRDQLLGYPVREKDWVVVGASPEQMLAQGYQQVGRDFPVFLHPKTREEYALARTERKSAPGYYGFECHFDSSVTLEEDLLRRDLTLNAIAQDSSGQLIDPYGGLNDLKAKVLRHVSKAFAEDPVRVLRVARFAARYHHLGFRVAEETRELMAAMVRAGELEHLVLERVWQEWSRSLGERNPEVFITTLRQCGALKVVIPELDCLFGVPNPVKYHPEIDTGAHTLMTLQAAVKLTDNPITRFAALLHDIGKGLTPPEQWPSHHGHEHLGLDRIKSLCQRLRIPTAYREAALMTSRYHLTIHQLFELRPATIVTLLENTDAFRRPQGFAELLIACEADARGKAKDIGDYPQAVIWRKLQQISANVSAKPFIDKGIEGAKIKQALHQQRVAEVKAVLENLKHHEK